MAEVVMISLYLPFPPLFLLLLLLLLHHLLLLLRLCSIDDDWVYRKTLLYGVPGHLPWTHSGFEQLMLQQLHLYVFKVGVGGDI